VNPRNAGVLSDLALYHAMLLEKSPASDLLQRALRLSPDDPAIQLLAAKVQVQFGQYPAAMAALERSRKLGTSAFVVRDDPEFRPLASEVQYQSVARP
jgi:predicted Zn-dependent protease